RGGATVLAWSLAPGVALGSPLFELVGGVAGDGGFNGRAVEGGSASTYFNPAFLPHAPSGFALGLFVLDGEIGIRLHARPPPSPCAAGPSDPTTAERRGGAGSDRSDLPPVCHEAGNPPPPPDSPPPPRPRQGDGSSHNTHVYQVIGFVTKLFDGRLAVGLYS